MRLVPELCLNVQLHTKIRVFFPKFEISLIIPHQSIFGKFSQINTRFCPLFESHSFMKKVTAKIAALLLTTLLGVTAQALEVNQPAPLFSLPGVQAAVDLSSFKGQTVYLDFWASWCGPCKQSFPWMNEMQTKYSSKGLRVVAVNVDQRHADATLFLKDNPTNFTVAFDANGQTPKNYAIRGMPTSVLIGPDGKVLSIHNGFKEEQRDEMEKQIKQALHL